MQAWWQRPGLERQTDRQVQQPLRLPVAAGCWRGRRAQGRDAAARGGATHLRAMPLGAMPLGVARPQAARMRQAGPATGPPLPLPPCRRPGLRRGVGQAHRLRPGQGRRSARPGWVLRPAQGWTPMRTAGGPGLAGRQARRPPRLSASGAQAAWQAPPGMAQRLQAARCARPVSAAPPPRWLLGPLRAARAPAARLRHQGASCLGAGCPGAGCLGWPRRLCAAAVAAQRT